MHYRLDLANVSSYLFGSWRQNILGSQEVLFRIRVSNTDINISLKTVSGFSNYS